MLRKLLINKLLVIPFVCFSWQVISLQSQIWRSYENKNMRNYMKINSMFIFQPTNWSLVEKLLKSLKTSKAAGPDNIPAHIIKDVYKELASPLCLLMNESIKTDIFPIAERVATVTLILQVWGSFTFRQLPFCICFKHI